MIKRIFLMLLFIISTVDINYAQHMKFNGYLWAKLLQSL